MLAPGRYIVHAYVPYTESQASFNPETFAARVRALIPSELRGLAILTENLPFNPFAQTYKKSSALTGDLYYVLVTLWLYVEQYLDEALLKHLFARAFWEAGAGRHTNTTVDQMAASIGICSRDIQASGWTWTQALVLEQEDGDVLTTHGCIFLHADPDSTSDNWFQKAWDVVQSGYQRWRHTSTPLTPVVRPPGTTGGGSGTPGGTTGTPGRTGPTMPPAPTTTGPNMPPVPVPNTPPVLNRPPTGSLWSEPGVKIAVGAAALTVVGVIIWAIVSAPPSRPPAGRPTNRSRSR